MDIAKGPAVRGSFTRSITFNPNALSWLSTIEIIVNLSWNASDLREDFRCVTKLADIQTSLVHHRQVETTHLTV